MPNLSTNLSTDLSVDPFEQTLNRLRSRRRVPEDPLAFGPSGFNEAGTAYSAGADVDKQVGLALEEYKARATNPRGLHESPEEYARRTSTAGDILRNELMPYGINLGGSRRTAAAGPRVFEMGNELVQVDPITGKANSIFTRKVDPGMSWKDKQDYAALRKERTALASKGKILTLPEDLKRIAEIDEQLKSFGAPAAAAPAASGYQSAEDVRAAYRQKKISREQAAEILRSQFKM